MAGIRTAAFACCLALLLAGIANANARPLRGEPLPAGRQLQQVLGFVPQGCTGVGVIANAHRVAGAPDIIMGAVTLTNANNNSVPISTVAVTLANDVGMPPMTTTATCDTNQVPWNPIAYELGQLVCRFAFALPEAGPAATAAAWTSTQATFIVGMSGAACNSPVATVQPPLVYGH